MKSKKFAQNLIDYIYNSPTAFHAVKTSKELLDTNGFTELDSRKYGIYKWVESTM